MIVVIADDLTGAAEIAGISRRYETSVEILLESGSYSYTAEIVVMCTDTRSLEKEQAEQASTFYALEAVMLETDFVFKKIDSVLRGHILDEIKMAIPKLGYKKAVIIAANPSLGRTIRNGRYFINGTPVHETGFAADPEFPINDSSVSVMIKDVNHEVQILKHTDMLPDNGIFIGEAESKQDVEAWADKVGYDNNCLLVGAGDFYEAWISRQYNTAIPQRTAALNLPHLYVSGTAFDKSRAAIRQIEERLNCVAYLPDDKSRISEIIKTQKKAVIAIGEKAGYGSALQARTEMAELVKEIVEKENIKELFIEGGSTAAAILREMKIEVLVPVEELQRGVVKMKANDLCITMKPGSYELPQQIKDLYLLN